MFQIRSHSTSMLLLLREPARRRLRVAEHLRELMRVEVPLVEQALGRLDHRGDDSRPRDDAAHRADRALAGARRDLAELELELRRAGQRVAPLVHRRRAGVRGLAAEGDLVPLDPERPEHDAQRQAHRLEHRPLLDVQLEVGGGALQLRARLQRAVELDAVLAQRIGQRHARPRRAAAAARPGRPSSRRPPTSRTASGRSARPPRRPSPPAARSSPAARPRRAAAAPRRRPPRSGSRRASRRSAPSRCARRSAPPAPRRRAASTTGCPPRRARTRAAGRRACRAATRAPAPRCPSRRPAARRSRRRSARAAPSARRPFSQDRAARRDANPRSGVW